MMHIRLTPCQPRSYNPRRSTLEDLVALHRRYPTMPNREKAAQLGVCLRTVMYWNRLLRIRGLMASTRTHKVYRGKIQVGGSRWREGVDYEAVMSIASEIAPLQLHTKEHKGTSGEGLPF